MKVTDYITEFLYQKGISTCFELSGGMITHLLDSLSKNNNIKIISCHHEQAAGFSAEGYARATGKPGIALATSGPGATNLITAIASCYFDSSPALFITGQVNTYELSKGSKLRQLGFQETNIVDMTTKITKKSIQLENIKQLPEILAYLFELSMDKRQGPCLLDIPMNLQSKIFTKKNSIYLGEEKKISKIKSNLNSIFQEKKVSSLSKSITFAKRPLILFGGGCSTKKNREVSLKLLNLLNLPVVCSLMGKDSVSDKNDLKVGFIGSYGNRWANKIFAESDLLLVLGSRLDIKQTGSNTKSFSEGKDIWHIDIDNNELINKRITNKNLIQLNIHQFYSIYKKINLNKKFNKNYYENLKSWKIYIQKLKMEYPIEKEFICEEREINPIKFLDRFSRLNQKETFYITDVGQHQMWAAQSLYIKEKDRFLTSGGMGAMGFGLPTAIGAHFGNPIKKIVLICGDGGFQLNIQELETIKRNNIKITIILINNYAHGMVRQFQESYFNKNYQSTIKGYSAPNFQQVVNAYGMKSYVLKDNIDIENLILKSLKMQESHLIELIIKSDSNVYPKLSFGKKFGEMEPDTKPISM